MITIRPITQQNEQEVRAVRPKKEQSFFIETVDACLKEAAEEARWHPVAIYEEEQVVGFAMYGAFGKNPDVWIDRIVIDAVFQGKGYGRQAMEQLMTLVLSQYESRRIYLSIVESNERARRLYEHLGFQSTERYDPNGELIFQYDKNE